MRSSANGPQPEAGATADEVSFEVRLTPRAGADAIDGVRDGVLRARVRAAPVEGGANTALVRLVAGELGLRLAAIRLDAGARGRTKRLAVRTDAALVLARWPCLRLGGGSR